MSNIILQTDSYKLSHWKQYPKGTTKVFSYFKSRGSDVGYTDTVFFGLQYLLKKYLLEPITAQKIAEADDLVSAHMGSPKMFNREGWFHILDKHQGKLPVRIRAVPEGTVVPLGNVLMTIENTDPECFWLTNYLETLLVQTWAPSTVCTYSRDIKKIIKRYLELTGDPSLLPFKLHDFGYRGVSSQESAEMAGLAHLVNFMGTDTIAALVAAKKYYNEDKMPGFSIPAAEHSTMTAYGDYNEAGAYRTMLREYPEGLVAVVSDSWDFQNAVDNIWGKELRDEVLARNGTVVIRPDSGDPLVEVPKALGSLGKSYGCETNSKGYRVLHPKIRMIWGDGMNKNSILYLLQTMERYAFSADNLAFGCGGKLLQVHNRDDMKFAFKCSYIEVDGKGRDVSKHPKTADWKKSEGGQFSLIREDPTYESKGFKTVKYINGQPHPNDIMQTVYENGELLVDQSLTDIRKRAEI